MLESDLAKVRALVFTGAYASGSDSTLPAGYQAYEELAFGGLGAIPQMSIAIISPRFEKPGAYVISQLYQAYFAEAVSMPYSREKATAVKVKFDGLAVPSRPVTDQIGKIYRQT